MTNKERQARLDKKKWDVGVSWEQDPSGAMAYCDYCDRQVFLTTCQATQQEREALCLCAKAYNKMRRADK